MQMWRWHAVADGERNVKLPYLPITPVVELLGPLTAVL
jgi:hypothetical protein